MKAALAVILLHALFLAALSTEIHWQTADCDTDTQCADMFGGNGDPD
jgi:hypothetical protein